MARNSSDDVRSLCDSGNSGKLLESLDLADNNSSHSLSAPAMKSQPQNQAKSAMKSEPVTQAAAIDDAEPVI